MGTREIRRAEPDSPTDLTRRSWLAVLRRSVREFRDDNVTDWAAALTYYGVLALFPGLLIAVSVLGLLGDSAARSLLDNVGQIAPGGVRDFLRTIIDNAQQQRGTAGVAAVVGLLLALWSASAYVGAFMRASNAIYGVGEGRPVWKTAPVRLAVTVAVMVMLLISAAIVLLTGRVADQVGRALGIGHTAVTVWDIAKWPVLLVLVSLTLALLYWACPNVRQPGFRWITPGGLVAVVIWLVASGGFAVYVANFASYNKTYGSVAGVIVFLRGTPASWMRTTPAAPTRWPGIGASRSGRNGRRRRNGTGGVEGPAASGERNGGRRRQGPVGRTAPARSHSTTSLASTRGWGRWWAVPGGTRRSARCRSRRSGTARSRPCSTGWGSADLGPDHVQQPAGAVVVEDHDMVHRLQPGQHRGPVLDPLGQLTGTSLHARS